MQDLNETFEYAVAESEFHTQCWTKV